MFPPATKVTSDEEVLQNEWLTLFPKDFTNDYTSSKTFIKQLTVVAISSLTYLRNAFPKESYTTASFAGFWFRLLKENCMDDMAQFVSSTLKDTFEAFDKKYIHQLALCFYNGDGIAENLIECHTFEYSYNSEGASMNINSKNRKNDKKSRKWSLESTQERTVMLFRTLQLFVNENCVDELPLNYEIGLFIQYNEDTPKDFIAPGFVECTGPHPISNTLRSAVRYGHVRTPYHKFVARTYLPGLKIDAEPSDPSSEITQEDDFQEESVIYKISSESSLEPLLSCPCGKQDAEDQAVITCRYCHKQHHAVCFGLMALGKEYCCTARAEKDPSSKSTSSILGGMVKQEITPLTEFSEVELPNKYIFELPLNYSHSPLMGVPRLKRQLKKEIEDDEFAARKKRPRRESVQEVIDLC